MSPTHALVNTLKKSLKAHGLTYRDVAKALRLSEASVKRLFSEQTFSLVRFDQVCQIMDLHISDLVRLMESDSRTISELTEKQEWELVSDIKLLLVAFLVVNGWSFNEIVNQYYLSETETIRHLANLDRLKLIELLPTNRIKLLTSSNFSWRKNGPIQQFFTAHLQDDFFKSRFDQTDESFIFLSGMLSGVSNHNVIKKLERLAVEFDELNEQDRRLPLEQRFGYSVILAVRPWRPHVFEELRKD